MNAPRRIHAVTGLRRDRAEEYFRLHAAPSPQVLELLAKACIRNFSIAVREIAGNLYLFSYYEYVGEDIESDIKRVSAHPEMQRWWQLTEPCQKPLNPGAAGVAVWSEAREIFYMSGR